MNKVPLHNETILLAKVANGDERAFSELFDVHFNKLGNHVFRITKSLEVSEEIVQDTFIKIWLGREKLKEVRNFSDYLFIVGKNLTLDHLRKRAKQMVLSADLEAYLKDAESTAETENPLENYRALIDNAVDKLPAQAKKVYIMSRHQRFKYDEIATSLGISPETVKKHIQYAVSFIKKDVSANVDLIILMILTSQLVLS